MVRRGALHHVQLHRSAAPGVRADLMISIKIMTHHSYLDLTSVSPELPLLPIRELRSSRLSTGLQKKARLPTQIRATPTRYIRLNWKQRNLALQHLGFI